MGAAGRCEQLCQFHPNRKNARLSIAPSVPFDQDLTLSIYRKRVVGGKESSNEQRRTRRKNSRRSLFTVVDTFSRTLLCSVHFTRAVYVCAR